VEYGFNTPAIQGRGLSKRSEGIDLKF